MKPTDPQVMCLVYKEGEDMGESRERELLPCPFCGNAPRQDSMHVVCGNSGCAIWGFKFTNKEWSRRAQPPAQTVDQGPDSEVPVQPARSERDDAMEEVAVALESHPFSGHDPLTNMARGIRQDCANIARSLKSRTSPAAAPAQPQQLADRFGLIEPADKMAEGIRRAVQSGALDARSFAADGELIYRARRERRASAALQNAAGQDPVISDTGVSRNSAAGRDEAAPAPAAPSAMPEEPDEEQLIKLPQKRLTYIDLLRTRLQEATDDLELWPDQVADALGGIHAGENVLEACKRVASALAAQAEQGWVLKSKQIVANHGILTKTEVSEMSMLSAPLKTGSSDEH